MPDAPTAPPSASRCQARPRAARPGYREDMLCASTACTVVVFHGREVAVCRIHEAKYQRWGPRAEEQAEAEWAWAPPPGPELRASMLMSVRA
jgi:hypothetical protein